MTSEEARLICREKLGLRVGSAMSEYIVRQIAPPDAPPSIPVIGGDARTGIPARKEFPVALSRNETHT